MQQYMVIDVESVGLHGEGFAVGIVVIDETGHVDLTGHFACPSDAAAGSDEGRAWVRENCPDIVAVLDTPREVRDGFWHVWQDYKAHGALLVADCAWPVEARFLAACVDDDPEARAWQGPYPLHELASFMAAAGMDPMATRERLADEPQHDPLGDAKQSARLLMRAFAELRKREARG
jgi:hypothetical protein